MVWEIQLPRKQRTRQHVIADLSMHHVERFILLEGYAAERAAKDYGYDLYLTTFDAFWLHIQDYFRQDSSRQPKEGSKTVRVHVPANQPLNRRAIRHFRALKQDLLLRLQGVQLHV